MINKIKLWLGNLWNSFPVQLLLLHFKKHQLILVYWIILYATVAGRFMYMFGANSLFLAPEYLDSVSFFSTFVVGLALGVFIMSWNITTFILYSRHFKFLATANKPFLIYCFNNFIIPTTFLGVYIFNLYHYVTYNELLSTSLLWLLLFGLLLGVATLILISFIYFFRADRTIAKNIAPIFETIEDLYHPNAENTTVTSESELIKVKTYLVGIRKTALVREVKHYNKAFIIKIFSRHHIAGLFLILFAFAIVIASSFFLDNPVFQPPAAASVLVLFAILLALFGALAYFLQNWSLPFTIGVFFILNFLFKQQIIDPTNKAYGLHYKTATRPNYDSTTINQLCNASKIATDSLNMVAVLNNWKAKQGTQKPILYFINVSGGGSRSATFTMQVMRQMDSILAGKLMHKTFMINGASGGMLGAAYYRALYWQHKKDGNTNPNTAKYITAIGQDLLNPLFSSLVARDMLSPIQNFKWKEQTYNKDRGYAFEQRLNTITEECMNYSIADLAPAEYNATIPLMLFSSVITRDGRKMLVSSQPISFLMKPAGSTTTPDAVDFCSFFKNQSGNQLRQLTALRMNATFPIVLPNVWLPSNPVIDVMDAGVRDNFGQEISLRFISKFKTWLKENVNKVVIINIRDRPEGNWDMPFDINNLSSVLAKPVTQMQYNIFKVQDYTQNEFYNAISQDTSLPIQRLTFAYQPAKNHKGASLSFHLTNSEKQMIKENVWNDKNSISFNALKNLNK